MAKAEFHCEKHAKTQNGVIYFFWVNKFDFFCFTCFSLIHFSDIYKKLHSLQTTSVACRCGLWMIQINIRLWSPHLSSSMQMSPNLNFQVILQVDLRWPFDRVNIQRFPYHINKPSLVQMGLQLFKMRPFSYFQPILQLDLRWPLTLVYDLCMKI